MLGDSGWYFETNDGDEAYLYEPNGEFNFGEWILQDAKDFAAALAPKKQWRFDLENAPKDDVVEVVGRYPEATKGAPHFAAYVDGKWYEYTMNEPQELVVWAWRPRGEWPTEQEAIHAGARVGGL